MKFKVAVVQFQIKQYDPNYNLRRAEIFIKKASDARANVIVFPEDFITGPVMGKEEFVDKDNTYKDNFRKLAKKYKIDVVAGSFIEQNNHGWYNTSYYIDSRGKVKGIYRKINLWHPERSYLTSGNEICVFNTKWGKAGLIICWDLAFPEIFRRMINKGVKIVYCPSFWCKEDAGIGLKYDINAEIKNVNSLCTTRAFENGMVIVYANAAKKFKFNKIKGSLIGQSQITLPFIGAKKRIDHNKECMFIQEIDTAILKDCEKAYKIRSDIKKRIF